MSYVQGEGLYFIKHTMIHASSQTHALLKAILDPFSQLLFTCSKLRIETLEKAVKYIQN